MLSWRCAFRRSRQFFANCGRKLRLGQSLSRQRERLDNSTRSFACWGSVRRQLQVVYSRYVLPQPKICAKFCQSPTVAAGAVRSRQLRQPQQRISRQPGSRSIVPAGSRGSAPTGTCDGDPAGSRSGAPAGSRSPSVLVRRLAAGSPCWQPCGRGDGAPIRPPQRQLPSRRRKGQLRQQAAKPWAPRR